MDKILANLKTKLQKALQEAEIIVDDVSFRTEGKYQFLTVTLDKVGGIDLDTIVEATKTVNEIVDAANIPVENYILDVVSKERG